MVPKGMVMQAVPKNVSFQRGALHYKASYTRKANTLNVRREHLPPLLKILKYINHLGCFQDLLLKSFQYASLGSIFFRLSKAETSCFVHSVKVD